VLLFFSFTVIRTSRPRLAAKVTPSPQPGLGAFKGTLGDPVAKIGADQVAGNSNLKLGDTGTPGGWFQKVEFVYSIYHPSGGDIKYTKSLYYWDLNQATERSAQIHRTRRKPTQNVVVMKLAAALLLSCPHPRAADVSYRDTANLGFGVTPRNHPL
jgi:hypothetical protein